MQQAAHQGPLYIYKIIDLVVMAGHMTEIKGILGLTVACCVPTAHSIARPWLARSELRSCVKVEVAVLGSRP